jgi:hypothetical protein
LKSSQRKKVDIVGWVKPATAITGLDHLGSVAPCIAIYSTLLPGLTNVTDRARYYSFYPWFLWKFAQTNEKLESVHFHDLYRRADCLFTLVAEYHSLSSAGDADRHGSRMVGRDTLVPAIKELQAGAALKLSDFATQNEQGRRYFKNRLGGLGQYYLGTLEDLGILTGRKGQFVQYDPVLGADLAKRFDAGVPGDLFWKTLKHDKVTLSTLTQLSPFCPCQLSGNKPEHELLTNLFFGKLNDDETSRVRRRKSLALILDMTRAIASDPEATLDPWTFRSCCYCASLPTGAAWRVPEALESIRDEWRLYERNEFLSVACQALLTIFVRSLELLPSPPSSAAIVVHYLLGDKTLKPLSRTPWVKYLAARRKVLPAIDKASNANHEMKLMEALFDLDTGEGSLADLGRGVKLVLEVLASLVVRKEDDASPPYGALPITPTLLSDYPINLITFEEAAIRWRAMNVGEVFESIMCDWISETHLRIALKKLRFEHLDTFRFYPTDQGLKPREVPPFGYSNPRVRQAIQILRDLSALEADADGRLQLTQSGAQWSETVCRS